MAKRPTHEIRHGLIKAKITKRPGTKPPSYSLFLVRLYRNGDQWKESTRLGVGDLPLARLVLDEAHTWMLISSGVENTL